MLDNRKLQILREIMNANKGIHIKNLQEKMKVSRRTIYYDIKMINYWLETNGLDAINTSRQSGFSINLEKEKAIEELLPVINEYEYEPSADERMALILILITCTSSKYGIQELSDLTNVARSTCLKDIKNCSEFLKKFEVGLDYDRVAGYYLLGNEMSVRKSIAYAITLLLDHFHAELLNEKLRRALNNVEMDLNIGHSIDFFKEALMQTESILERKFNDRMLRFISYYLGLITFRIRREIFVDYPQEEGVQVKHAKEYTAAQVVCTKMKERFSMNLNDGEFVHVAIQLLCASLDAYYVNQPNDLSTMIKNEIIPDLIREFEILSCIVFENKPDLQKNLYVHFLPAYYRAVYQIHVENPIKDEIIMDYGEIYSLTKRALRPTEVRLGITFNESETTYFAMHFGSWFKNQGLNLNTKNIAVVCPSGIATSNFIAKQIVNLVPDECNVRTYSFREFESKKPKVDLVVSTSYLNRLTNALCVTPIITSDDKKEILNRLGYTRKTFYKNEIVHDMLNIVEKYCEVKDMEMLVNELKNYFSDDLTLHEEVTYKPMLSELIISDHIRIVEQASDWKEAIKMASEPLLNRKYINQEYVDAMIDTVVNVGPYFVIGPRIAIPHARPENGVNKLSMSLLKLNQDVDFNDDEEHSVNLIIILAAEDNSSHLKALSQLTTLLSRPEEVEAIMKAESVAAILSVIEKY
ncbi:Transcriptional antiterminator [Anaerovirgula multivorans]|uniref:Transcriptional antiterminator n=1 Tax=Anaerovirgula multivorans TaxID=312168 RepID=A0A239F734_9FIRM|nr:BglG family transcription antiterminator [Anaerovirgula multivorans]SNS51894.1 Transcriptional antiterminator [Anaerovirgula multivorans]